MSIKERMPQLIERRQRLLVTGRQNAADPEKDRNGCCSDLLIGTIRFLGIGEYIESRNVDLFRQKLSEAAKMKIAHFERSLKGEPIDESYLTMLSYEQLFDALAAGDSVTAERLANFMGGRAEIEKEHDHPFDYCLGYTLKAFVDGKPELMLEWATKFSSICREPDNLDFAGYAQVFSAILKHDSKMAQEGLVAIVKGHARQSKRGGVFYETVDEVLCVWGIGIANLARRAGTLVEEVPPMIPIDLLV